MRYVSFFSGIEMASLAFEPLGWECVAVAEVDPFASAVIAHHHPAVPNLGDITAITEEQIAALGPIDLIIGGFPCQDVSVAGKRKGLKNHDGTVTRSGLFFDAMRLVRAANPRWLVLENVPGLYSNHGGRDFAVVVGEIVGSTFDVPRDGWQDTGAAAGPRGMVEWCCLDAQWRGLAQRRERVFFVADFGAWTDRPPVLLERESLSGNPPACVAARARSSVRSPRGTGRQGIWEQIASAFRRGGAIGPTPVARTIGSVHGGADEHDAEAGRLIPSISGTLNANGKAAGSATQQDAENDMLVVTPLRASGAAGANGAGVGYPGDPSLTLDCDGSAGIAVAYGGNDTSGPRDIAACLNAKGGASRMDFESETLIAHTLRGGGFDASEDGTGRGTPLVAVEAYRTNALGQVYAQGDLSSALTTQTDPTTQFIAFHARQDPDCSGDVTHHLDTDGTSIGIAFDTTQITSGENRCNPQAGDPCHPLSATAHPPAYATAYEVRRLTPKECERLMGVPDTYTLIPYRGKNAADGPRYKCLGNGFAVPVVRWIGERIERAMAEETAA